jgi:hypothetical protein
MMASRSNKQYFVQGAGIFAAGRGFSKLYERQRLTAISGMPRGGAADNRRLQLPDDGDTRPYIRIFRKRLPFLLNFRRWRTRYYRQKRQMPLRQPGKTVGEQHPCRRKGIQPCR